ncbi:MAG: succinate dehydrogenase/fumarate reductase cytochrome b subunit [Planctomycetota bacterium]|jgi:succinate dehydrogenase/fumarate reductase cytochrome b subunit
MSQSNVRRMIRIQAISGLVFGTFLILHLVNTLCASGGQESYDGVIDSVRAYYQWPLTEAGVVGIFGLVHIAIGLRCALARRRSKRAFRAEGGAPPPVPTWSPIHRVTGWFLLFVIFSHFLATRGPGLMLDQPLDPSYIAFSLIT